MEHNSRGDRAKKASKSQKKVTFDTKTHHINIAKKSTASIPCRSIHGHKTGVQKQMCLRLTKIDTTGYKLPRKPTDDVCARLLPLDRVKLLAEYLRMENKTLVRPSAGITNHVLPEISSKIKDMIAFRPKNKGTSKKKKKSTEKAHRKNDADTKMYAKASNDSILSPAVESTDIEDESALIETEYEMKLKETIDKMTGVQNKTNKKSANSDSVVRLPLESISKSPCGLEVKTLSVTVNTGIQAERGFVVNKEVMDSYVAVKINEALYEMKERLQSVEEQFERVSEEKTKMEEIMKDKVHMIRELSRPGFKPCMKDIAVATDPIDPNPLVNKASSSPTTVSKKPKRSKIKRRQVATQTESNDQFCFHGMNEASIAPYLHLRSTSPVTQDSESDAESENGEKMEWMFQRSSTCARCHAIRPQVRLLRALKKNLTTLQLHQKKLMLQEGVLSDDFGWDALGLGLQHDFAKIFKLTQILQVLPLEPTLGKKVDVVMACLKHLLSHLPLPTNLTQTIDVREVNKPRTKAMAAYVFGWKLKEVINLLRRVYWSSEAKILPRYFRAELVQADRVAFRTLTFAVQGMRNLSISHDSLLLSDKEFLSSCTTVSEPSTPLSVSTVEGSVNGDGDSATSYSSDSDLDDIPPPPKRLKRMRRRTKSAESTSQALLRNNSTPSCEGGQQVVAEGGLPGLRPLTPRIFQGLSMPQLLVMSKLVNFHISKIKNAASKSVGTSTAQPISASVSSVQKPSSFVPPPSLPFHINVSNGNNQRRVLCNPLPVRKTSEVNVSHGLTSGLTASGQKSTATIALQLPSGKQVVNWSFIGSRQASADAALCARVVPFSSALHSSKPVSEAPGAMQSSLPWTSPSSAVISTKPATPLTSCKAMQPLTSPTSAVISAKPATPATSRVAPDAMQPLTSDVTFAGPQGYLHAPMQSLMSDITQPAPPPSSHCVSHTMTSAVIPASPATSQVVPDAEKPLTTAITVLKPPEPPHVQPRAFTPLEPPACLTTSLAAPDVKQQLTSSSTCAVTPLSCAFTPLTCAVTPLTCAVTPSAVSCGAPDAVQPLTSAVTSPAPNVTPSGPLAPPTISCSASDAVQAVTSSAVTSAEEPVPLTTSCNDVMQPPTNASESPEPPTTTPDAVEALAGDITPSESYPQSPRTSSSAVAPSKTPSPLMSSVSAPTSVCMLNSSTNNNNPFVSLHFLATHDSRNRSSDLAKSLPEWPVDSSINNLRLQIFEPQPITSGQEAGSGKKNSILQATHAVATQASTAVATQALTPVTMQASTIVATQVSTAVAMQASTLQASNTVAMQASTPVATQALTAVTMQASTAVAPLSATSAQSSAIIPPQSIVTPGRSLQSPVASNLQHVTASSSQVQDSSGLHFSTSNPLTQEPHANIISLTTNTTTTCTTASRTTETLTVLMSRLLLSQPMILDFSRGNNSVTIKWTFPADLQPYVIKFMLYYSDTNSLLSWTSNSLLSCSFIGSVNPLPLPMVVTLNQTGSGEVSLFAIKASFSNGLHSQFSLPIIV